MSDEQVNPAAVFFVAGGTVPPNSPSYVERAADRELFEALSNGEYCYVLNARQMGKSSLAVRTIARLTQAGITCAFVDLTRLGGSTVTPDQWYSGLLVETGRALGNRASAIEFLRENRELGPSQRFLNYLQDVALSASVGPIVLMIDEIDAVRSLPFSSAELFAGIRNLHNGRASSPMLSRLTVCLVGAALPSDLIADPRTTPFNIGRRIGLRDFTTAEAQPLSSGLGSQGSEVLERVLHWTGGHPYLTQALCAELAKLESPSSSDVDRLVQDRYLDARARDTDTNLADLANRLLGRGDPSVTDADREDTLSLYGKLLRGGIADDEGNPSAARIKMSGAARLEGGRLIPRNRIYSTVFGHAWVKQNMPGQEVQRQKRAFRAGVVRTSIVSALALVIVACIAVITATGAQIARREQRKSMALLETSRQLATSEKLAKMEALKAVDRAQKSLARELAAESKVKIAAANEHAAKIAAQKAEALAESAEKKARMEADRAQREYDRSQRLETRMRRADLMLLRRLTTSLSNPDGVRATVQDLYALTLSRTGDFVGAEKAMRAALADPNRTPAQKARNDTRRIILALILAKKGDLAGSRRELAAAEAAFGRTVSDSELNAGNISIEGVVLSNAWTSAYAVLRREVHELLSKHTQPQPRRLPLD